MHKFVIMIEEQEDWTRFETQWPAFLRLAESLPGLQREATSRVEHHLFGRCAFVQVHELFFNTRLEAEQALASPEGMAAGRLLQQISAGRLTLFLADHKEDDMENIRKYRAGEKTAE
jgi:hypothetical protein